MARASRLESRTRLYHVVAKGNNGEKVFRKNREKQQFLTYMEYMNQKADVEMFAYCIMDDHVHFMLRADLEELSRYMHDLIGRYSMYYNVENERTGHVFQGRFESECIERENRFWGCLRYIHNHPVEAGISKEIYLYSHSSVQEYFQKKSNLIHPSARKILKSRCRTRKEFFDFHKTEDDNIFLDMAEEQKRRKCAVMRGCLETFLEECQILPGEFFLSPLLKKKFMLEMHEKFKMSYRQIYEIFELICLDIRF